MRRLRSMRRLVVVLALLAAARCSCPEPPAGNEGEGDGVAGEGEGDAGEGEGEGDEGEGEGEGDAGEGEGEGDAGEGEGDAGEGEGDAGEGEGEGEGEGDAGEGEGEGEGEGDVGVVGCESGDVLCVILRWDSPRGDLDLHLTKEGEETCGVYGCYFGNCTAGDQRADFDDSFDVSSGDPVLVDDTFGEGPEIVRLRNAFPGDRFVVGVFAQPPSSGPTTTASVTVVSFGKAVETFNATLTPNQFWNAADVAVTGSTITAVALDDVCAVDEWICSVPAGQCSD